MSFRLHRLALAEIDHEVDYYESRRPGLGVELEDEIDVAFSVIYRFPLAAAQWRNRRDRRVYDLDRFPFTIRTSGVNVLGPVTDDEMAEMHRE